MKIPEIVVLRKGNLKNRLTVTPQRITLKLRDDVSEEQESHLRIFATLVAQRTLPIYFRAMRGSFSKDLLSIEVRNTNRSLYCLYCYDELELDGLADSGMRVVGGGRRTRSRYSTPIYSGGGESNYMGFGVGGGYGGYGGGGRTASHFGGKGSSVDNEDIDSEEWLRRAYEGEGLNFLD
jgi:hypothetical protein